MTIEGLPDRRRKFDAELEDWTPIVDLNAFNPSQVELRLVGKIVGDQANRFPDGRLVLTSPIRSARSRIVTGAVVRSQSTRYRLLTRSSLDEIQID